MRTGNINPTQTRRPDDSIWYFVAEFPLNEWVLDRDRNDKPKLKLLIQTVRDLGIPPECIENIELSLIGFMQETRGQIEQQKSGLLGSIRIFCQKKQTGDLSSARSPKPGLSKHTLDSSQMLHRSHAKMHGGWGFFLIERSAASSAGSPGCPPYIIDLYLYEEGE